MSAKGKNIHFKRLGREFALQFLFQFDVTKGDSLASLCGRSGYESALEYFWEQLEEQGNINDARSGRKGKLFAEKLIHGVIDNKEKVDSIISRFAEKWTMERMAVVDRNVLRIAVYEMLYCPDIPPVVSINEAVEIVKAFGGENSGGFINGILNSVKDSLDRPPRERIG